MDAQFKRARWRRINDSIFIRGPVEEISRQAMPVIAGAPWRESAKARLTSARRDLGFLGSRIRRDKIVPVHSAADRVRPRSKSPVVRDRVVRSGIQPPE